MITKRYFLKSVAVMAGMPFLLQAKNKIAPILKPDIFADDDAFWQSIRADYDLKTEYINLENGYYCMMNKPIMEAYFKDIKHTNCEASYYMRTVQFENKLKTRDNLADLLGCDKEELIITRNTTEALDTVISGINWKPGDEAIMAWQDYGSMLDMFKQQEKRYGIVNKMISVPNHPKSDEEIVSLYENAITSKTRLIMVCHIINITGQILPIKKICNMAHSKGVEVMVDGAHAIAHINFKISDLNCDYYGSSLHKWLGTPLGAGILYVNKAKIKNLWPLFADLNFAENDIRKLNHTGTNPIAIDIAINHAIAYYLKIGIERKQERLYYLQNYWTSKLINNKRIVMNSTLAPNRSCAIANVGIEGIAPNDLAKILLEKYKIWTVAIDYPQANVNGVRITPNVYTTTKELDVFVNAMLMLAS